MHLKLIKSMKKHHPKNGFVKFKFSPRVLYSLLEFLNYNENSNQMMSFLFKLRIVLLNHIPVKIQTINNGVDFIFGRSCDKLNIVFKNSFDEPTNYEINSCYQMNSFQMVQNFIFKRIIEFIINSVANEIKILLPKMNIISSYEQNIDFNELYISDLLF